MGKTPLLVQQKDEHEPNFVVHNQLLEFQSLVCQYQIIIDIFLIACLLYFYFFKLCLILFIFFRKQQFSGGISTEMVMEMKTPCMLAARCSSGTSGVRLGVFAHETFNKANKSNFLP